MVIVMMVMVVMVMMTEMLMMTFDKTDRDDKMIMMVTLEETKLLIKILIITITSNHYNPDSKQFRGCFKMDI